MGGGVKVHTFLKLLLPIGRHERQSQCQNPYDILELGDFQGVDGYLNWWFGFVTPSDLTTMKGLHGKFQRSLVGRSDSQFNRLCVGFVLHTDSNPEPFGNRLDIKYILTNFDYYIQRFAMLSGEKPTKGSAMSAVHSAKLDVSIVNFSIGSPTAALIIELLAMVGRHDDDRPRPARPHRS